MAEMELRERLFSSIERSYRELECFRNMQRQLVLEYAGDGYGDPSDKKRETIVNLLNQTVEGYMMLLAANRPRVTISTRYMYLKPFAKHFEVALNNLISEINLDQTIRRWVLDAFFCVGVVKVHMASSGYVEIEQDQWADPGRPFASNVSLDNFVYDMSATKWSEIQYCGDVYRLPLEEMDDALLFDQEVVAELKPTSKRENDEDRLENISRGDDTDHDDFYPMVDLLDIWLPREGVIETYACELRNDRLKIVHKRPVAVMTWDGPEFGPYKLLGFSEVPENVMPTSPASHLAMLAQHINSVYRKQVNSAKEFKEITTYTSAGEKDARSARRAKHNEMVRIDDGTQLNRLRMNGVDAGNQQFMMSMMQDYDRSAGNLTALLGLGAQADTVGQEKLIHGAVGGKAAAMSARVMDGVVALIRDLGHLMWYDEVNTIPGEMEIPGLSGVGYSVDATWKPEDREGDFMDYNLTIDVSSMTYRSPQERLRGIMETLQLYAPFMQLFVAQGGIINFQSLNTIIADLRDEPRLKEIVRFTSALPDRSDPGPQGTPTQTTREYIRRSVSGGGQQAGGGGQQPAWGAMAGQQQQPALQTVN